MRALSNLLLFTEPGPGHLQVEVHDTSTLLHAAVAALCHHCCRVGWMTRRYVLHSVVTSVRKM